MWPKQEVLDRVKDIRAAASETFGRLGEVRPCAWLYATKHPETGADEENLIMMRFLGTFEPEARDMFSFAIRKFAQTTRAVGIVFQSEMWTLDHAYCQSIPRAQLAQEMNDWAGRLHEHPRRAECIMILLEHHRLPGTHQWFATIARDDKNVGTLGEWEARTMTKGEGRFINMLPTVH